MPPKEAADQLRQNFHLEAMPAEDRHHVKFIEDVAVELGVEPTPFNLHQVGQALDHAGIEPDSNEYPKMLYSRTHHTTEDVAASAYDARHDFVWARVASEEETSKLGPDWVENLSDLPPRGEIPIHAEPKPKLEMSQMAVYDAGADIDGLIVDPGGPQIDMRMSKGIGDTFGDHKAESIS